MRPVEIRVHQEVLFQNSYSEFQKQHEQSFLKSFFWWKATSHMEAFGLIAIMTWWNSVQTQLPWESSNSLCTWNLASTTAGTFCWYTSHCGKKEKRKIKQLFWEVTSKTKTFWFSIPRHNKEAIYIICAGQSQSNALAGLIKNCFKIPLWKCSHCGEGFWFHPNIKYKI